MCDLLYPDIIVYTKASCMTDLKLLEQPEPEFRPPMSEVVQALTRMVSDATKASM